MSVSGVAAPRVLMLLNRVPYPLNDGGAIAMYSALKGYYENGCRVHVLAMNTSKHYVQPEDIQKHISLYATGQTVGIDNNITFWGAFRNLFSSQSYIISRFVSPGFKLQLEEILKNGKYDIVHVDGLPCMPYMETIRTHSKAKVVYRAHNIEHQIWERSAAASGIAGKLYLTMQSRRLKVFEVNALQQPDYIFAISYEDKAYFESVSKVPVVLVPTGVEASQKVLPCNPNTLFFIGSFDWLPNVQGMEWFVKEIWPTLKGLSSELEVHIAGKNLLKTDTRFAAERCVVEGEVPDAAEFMNSHGVMIVPLLSGSGIRIKIIEALALGKPVIATSIAAEGLGLTHNFNIMIANNAGEFSASVNKCLTDATFLRRLQENAHTFARQNFNNKGIFSKALSAIGFRVK
jgi:glycosyltransferase involved in cell wall biosynthesis